MSERLTSDWDKRIIDGVSIALGGKIGQHDDCARLLQEIEGGLSEDKLRTACDIAVAFIRLAQDLKARNSQYTALQAKVRELHQAEDDLCDPDQDGWDAYRKTAAKLLDVQQALREMVKAQ